MSEGLVAVAAATLDHGGEGVAAGGSPMYALAADHLPALLAFAAVPLLGWGIARLADRGARPAVAVASAFRRLSADLALVAWLLAGDALAHVALTLVPGHGTPAMRLAFLLQAGILVLALRGLLLGRRWRGAAVVGLGGAILAYVAALLGSEAPDQAALAVKGLELFAIALVVAPRVPSRLRGAAGSASVIALTVLLAFGAWVGAFRAAAPPAGEASAPTEMATGHEHGVAPAPGTVMPAVDDRDPTADEVATVLALHDELGVSLARYRDPAAAEAAGYEIPAYAQGLDIHAGNAAYEHDGRVLDPDRPEYLIYGEGPDGLVLLGAMFTMPSFDLPGPAVGGPLTVWHAHEHVCLGALPPGLAGIASPLGGCPAGSVDLPRTGDMIHAWIVPGAPAFGDLPDAERRAWIDRQAAAGS